MKRNRGFQIQLAKLINSEYKLSNREKIEILRTFVGDPSIEIGKHAKNFIENLSQEPNKASEQINDFCIEYACFSLVQKWQDVMIRKYPRIPYENKPESGKNYYTFFVSESVSGGIGTGAKKLKLSELIESESTCKQVGAVLGLGAVAIGGSLVGGVKGMYNIFSRGISLLSETEQFEVFYLLSLAKDKDKQTQEAIIQGIVSEYGLKWHLVQSDSSVELINLLASKKPIDTTENKFKAIIDYMRKPGDGGVIYNNGKGLFSTIAEVVLSKRKEIVPPGNRSGLGFSFTDIK